MKRCPKCGATKSLSEFAPDKSKASGYSSRCKPCDAERSREYYARTGGEKARARYQANRKERIAQGTARRKRLYEAEPEKMRQYWREQWGKQWRNQSEATRAKSRARDRVKYMKRHGGIDEWARMYAEQGGLCYLCQQPLPGDRSKIAVDHDHSCCDVGPRDSRSCRYCRRGLTHQVCNQIWGLVRESPALLRAMADNGERVGAETRLRIASKPSAQEVLGTDAPGATEMAEPAVEVMPGLDMPVGASWPQSRDDDAVLF